MRVEDLVVLRYAHNECYVQVVSLMDANLGNVRAVEVDIARQKYSVKGSHDEMTIGKERNARKSSHGVIGVYDRTSILHLQAMVSSATEAVRDRTSHPGDD